ncbi:hypothetical protein J2Z79_001569 [Symbiobacterium terraclitae]|uniref:Uncharacterized protein n=1 Tax=Symbiobacterium terraclitae TaxID=557451 RepID=A0ABS4JRL7_9FIRM|nr:hypothetical protein [Symbiobacterium terraclitae]MBP2018170.1 hypothetical protein [Symbiobacterium terraclitae]
METLQVLVLLQLAAVLYLIYRVHRLEQSLGGRARGSRRSDPGSGSGKVVPLLKDNIPPGPFRPD